MNWKPTALAAVIVLVVGIAVGVLTSSDPKTTIKRVTVAASPTATASTAAPPTTTDAEVPAADTNAAAPATAEADRFDPERIEVVAATDGEPSIGDLSPAERIRLTDNSEGYDSPSWAMRTGYASKPPEYWQLTITPPAEDVTEFHTKIGFLKGAPAGNTIRVTFYRNAVDRRNVLAAYDVTSASTKKVKLDVSGVQQLLVRFTTDQDKLAGNSDGDPSMGMIEPYFV